MATENDGARQRKDPRETDELIQLALSEADEDAAWDAVVVLHFRATPEVLEKARGLCTSADGRERKVGADILGQLGVPERAFPEECYGILKKMLEFENVPDVLEAVGIAFGHLHDVRAVKLLAPLNEHADADVRMGVVYGISRHDEPLAIQTLIKLSEDSDDDVRDWATFELGSMLDTDTPEIRDALFRRLTDANDDARAEAMVGLARRKDMRVLSPLLEELGSESVGLLVLEAAEELGDASLTPALLALRARWEGDDDRHCVVLNRALLSCLPAGTSRVN